MSLTVKHGIAPGNRMEKSLVCNFGKTSMISSLNLPSVQTTFVSGTMGVELSHSWSPVFTHPLCCTVHTCTTSRS